MAGKLTGTSARQGEEAGINDAQTKRVEEH